MLARVTKDIFKPSHVKKLNRAINHVKYYPGLGLKVNDLKKKSLRLFSYADASFPNATDFSIQFSFVVSLSADTDHVNWINYHSYKCKRVVKVVFGGEDTCVCR